MLVFHVFSGLIYIYLLEVYKTNIELHKYILLSLYTQSLLFTFKDKLLNLYQLFLFNFFLFLLGRIFLDVVLEHDFRESSLLVTSYLSIEIALKSLKILIYYLMASTCGWLIFKIFNNNIIIKKYNEEKLNKIIRIVFYLYLFLYAIKGCYFIILYMKFGWMMFTNGDLEANSPLILKGVGTILEIIYIILISKSYSYKEVKKYSILYLGVMLIKFAIGKRAAFILSLLTYLFLVNKYYKNIKKKILFLWAAILIFFIQVIGITRAGGVFELKKIFENIVIKLIYSQSASIYVISGYLNHKQEMQNKFNFIVGYFVDFIKRVPNKQTIIKIQNGNYLGDQLTYILSEKMYLQGRGTGTSVVIELFDFSNNSFLLYIVIVCLYTYFIFYLSDNFYKNTYVSILSYFMIYSYIFSPRGSIKYVLPMIVTGFVVNLLFNILNRLVLQKNIFNKRNDDEE